MEKIICSNWLLMKCNNQFLYFSNLFFFSVRSYSKQIQCWKCNKLKINDDHFFCSKCGTIQKPDNEINFFTLFSINKPTFNLDLAKLDKKYKYLMMSLHPDKFSFKDNNEKDISLEQTTIITRAYQTLKDPNERAKYLLNILNLDINNANLSFEFLESMMYLIEKAENLTDKNLLNEMKNETEYRMHEIESNIQSCLEKDDQVGILNYVAELSYLNRIFNTIYEKVDVQ